MRKTMPSGAFTKRFAEGKRWGFDQGIADGLVELCRDKSVADFGAGIGRYVDYLIRHGIAAIGYDGIDGIEEMSSGIVKQIDLAGPVSLAKPSWHWVMSIETGEHIPPDSVDTFVCNIAETACEGIVVSWARIGQRGKGHVSCHSPEWVASKFGGYGFVVDEGWQMRLREMASDRGFSKKLLVMRK